MNILVPGSIAVSKVPVPHRDEYSETVGFVIYGFEKKLLFLPDIDALGAGAITADNHLGRVLRSADYIFIDATFYDDSELPGRDMSKIPHPRVTDTMDMFQDLPESTRDKIHFIHINHTNPIRFADSAESKAVAERGYNIARRGDRVCL